MSNPTNWFCGLREPSDLARIQMFVRVTFSAVLSELTPGAGFSYATLIGVSRSTERFERSRFVLFAFKRTHGVSRETGLGVYVWTFSPG